MTNQQSTADVAIVGAGVIGCAIAYYLAADHGIRSLIIERDGVASQASGGAAGELGAVGRHRFSAAYTQFLLRGIAMHEEMATRLVEEGGVDYRFGDIPMIRPAFDEHEAADLQQQMGWQREIGIDVEWLDGPRVHGLGSWLAEDAVGAAYTTEKQLEAYAFAIGLAQAAERHGVSIRTAEVTGILEDSGRATGVRIGDESITAGSVVLANGPWAQHAGVWLGLDVPVIPLRGQIVHVDLPPGEAMPHHAIFHESGYVLPKAGGDLLVGTTQERAGFDRNPTLDAQNGIMESVMRIAPKVADAPIRDLTACLRPWTEDELPLIGAVPGWEHLYLATGHGYKGVTLALVTGKSVADLIATGASPIPLDEYSPSRLKRNS